jgi:hypothetical protein
MNKQEYIREKNHFDAVTEAYEKGKQEETQRARNSLGARKAKRRSNTGARNEHSLHRGKSRRMESRTKEVKQDE